MWITERLIGIPNLRSSTSFRRTRTGDCTHTSTTRLGLNQPEGSTRVGGAWRAVATLWVLMVLRAFVSQAFVTFFPILYAREGYSLVSIGLVSALLTAIYMTRMMLYTFHGPNRTGKEEAAHLYEAPWIMTGPLVVLGVLALGCIGIICTAMLALFS